MKYVRDYNSFVRLSKKEIGKNASLVEKQILNEFSSDFWNLCMKSRVFTENEKLYIQNNLVNEKVSLIKEEWEWLDKAVNWAKEKGEKMLDFVKDKIKSVKEGLKGFVSSMVSFAKSLFTSGINYALVQAAKFKEKVSGEGKVKKQIEDLDPQKSKAEVSDLKKTFQFWAPGDKASTAKPAVEKVEGKIEAKVKSSEAEVISSTEQNLEEAQDEAQNESLSSILKSTNDDVLISFYNLTLIKEEKEEEKEGEKKSAGQKCIDWILGFLGQEKIDPEAKKGAKLLWWGKLFLKILSACLSPILKIVEALIKAGANQVLAGVSTLTAALGGPGAFKFALLGGLIAGIVGMIYDTIMLFGGSAGGADTMAAVKKWLATAINESLELFPSYKTLKYIFAGFCAGMTLWHVVEEIKHLAHGAHEHGEHKEGEHKDGEHKEGEKTPPAKPGEKPATGKPAEGKPEGKPAEGKPAA
jgi:hypothetical protein